MCGFLRCGSADEEQKLCASGLQSHRHQGGWRSVFQQCLAGIHKGGAIKIGQQVSVATEHIEEEVRGVFRG